MVYFTRRYILSPALCFVLEFFSPFSIAITSFREDRADPCAFRTFVYFAGVGLCLFSFPLCARDWLRLVIMALPGPFYLPYWTCTLPVADNESQSLAPITSALSPSLGIVICLSGATRFLAITYKDSFQTILI